MNREPERMSEPRPLTAEERQLAHWMLEHGGAEAAAFLGQLAHAHVVARCPCGCASIDFEVVGQPAPSGGLRILGDYVFGDKSTLAGVFIFERGGVLAGLEVYGLAGDAPASLPAPEALRPFPNESP